MMVRAVYSALSLDQEGHSCYINEGEGHSCYINKGEGYSCYINEGVAALKTGPNTLVDHGLQHTSAAKTVLSRTQQQCCSVSTA